VELDAKINDRVPWRPDILQTERQIGWKLHSVLPDSDSWERRILRAQSTVPRLQIGVAATAEALQSADFLLACHRLGARIISVKEKRDAFTVEQIFASIPDYVCERQIKLDADTARQMLDLALDRALKARTNAQKGVTLEVVVALMLSQVDNFEVAQIGISNRSQQMDVLVHNRSIGGVLGASPLILAEAKNWKGGRVTPTEYAAFIRKLQTRHRRAKLGFIVTTGSFTQGVALEARRDSKDEALVICLDGNSLPLVWRASGSITKNIERLVIEASVGT
jgi:hypothetical protein